MIRDRTPLQLETDIYYKWADKAPGYDNLWKRIYLNRHSLNKTLGAYNDLAEDILRVMREVIDGD